MMRKKFIPFISVLPALLVTLIFLFCELGDQPLGPTGSTVQDTVSVQDTVIWDEGSMEMYVDPSDLLAGYNYTAQVTVRLFNEFHNPIPGETVYFKTFYGIIEESAVTNASGVAEVTFTSEPINVEASVYAWIYDSKGNMVMVGQTITISGVAVEIIATPTNALLNAVVPVKILVTDADGKAVAKKPVILTGAINTTLLTKGNGSVDTSVTSASEGPVIINAESQGAFGSATVTFWKVIPDTVIDTIQSIRTLRVFSSKAQLDADNTDYAIITAILINELNNPAVGDTIQFFSDLGIIGEYGVIDTTGRTSVVLQSAPINGTCTVKAVAIRLGVDTATTKVTFSGVSLQLTADPTDLKTGEYSTVQALLTDASAHPIEGDNVTFTVTGGVFENNSTMEIVTLNTSGLAQVKVTSSVASTAVVHATSLNCSDSTSISFTNNILTLSANPGIISVGGMVYSKLTAVYRDGNNNLVSGAWINFYTNAGRLSADSAVTVNGVASVYLYSADFAGVATVQAVAPNGSATTTVEFVAIGAVNIGLKISPDNIGVNGGVASLIATVTDLNGNMVSGAPVNFRILQGPGGDEYIDKPAVTSKDGIARSQIYAGSVPSQYRGVEVEASVVLAADTSKMTISGEPYVVTVARPQSDTVVTQAGQINESIFEYFAGAVVQDVNGNNVANGMEVHFSVVVSGLKVAKKYFIRWSGIGSPDEVKAIIGLSCIDVPFEDINNNLQMDKNIDLDLDWYPAIASRGTDVDGNGIMEYNRIDYDFFWDFNLNGVCDVGYAEPVYELSKKYIYDPSDFDTTITGPFVDTTIVVDTIIGDSIVWDTTYTVVYDTALAPVVIDTTYEVWADLNDNGVWDKTELVNRPGDTDNECYLPESGDFEFWWWEMREYFKGRFDFHTNDFAVVIAASAVTEDGVAFTRLKYPRQMAHRLFVTVNAEINGIRDKDGERFLLPVIIKGKK